MCVGKLEGMRLREIYYGFSWATA